MKQLRENCTSKWFKKSKQKSKIFKIYFQVYRRFFIKKLFYSFVDWTNDETVFAILVTNEVLFFDKSDPSNFG